KESPWLDCRTGARTMASIAVPSPSTIHRRCFLMSAAPFAFADAFKARRTIGSTKFNATLLGIGDLADRNIPIETCVATVQRAMDAGLNVIDTAPGYEDGYSEEIVGRAIRGRRDAMFVIDKIDYADQPVAPQIDASLQRLGLDSVDCFVLHA